MSSRSYLSIGDVLTLLREEFPDVTISKIRFLESQGLVNPERSPSGYRKFFDHDVERLRWVLRQQREHFLPLKVIRDRLAEGNLDDIEVDAAAGAVPASDREPAHRNGRVPQPTHAGVGAMGAAGVRSAAAAGAGAGSGRTEEQLAKADDEAMARILADASRRAALIPEAAVTTAVPATGRPPLRVVGDEPASAAATAVTETAASPGRGAGTGTESSTSAGPGPLQEGRGTNGGPKATAGVASPSRPRRGEPGASDPAPGAARRDAGAPSATATSPSGRTAAGAGGQGDPPSPAAKGGSSAGRSAPGAGESPTVRAAPATSSLVTGASLTTEELCAASGLSEAELAGLQGFGLIEAIDVAGILTFDEDALTVANLAAEFRAFGIEPRHLRLYRNAVDRELGLIEQVIIPLLRQRNPESRQRAVDGAAHLGTLGQTMRATLLRSALRRHIGG